MMETNEDQETREPECRHYRVVRFYFKGGHRVIMTGLTLAEARAHCGNPETSSSSATTAKARQITRRMGAWFDGYDQG